MASSPLKKGGNGGGGGGGKLNFPEMNGVISVYGGTKSNNHKEGISYQ